MTKDDRTETKQKSLFEDDNQVVIEKERDPEPVSSPVLDYSIGITQDPSKVIVTVSIPVKAKLDLDQLKDDIKVASSHICMLTNIRDREATDG